MRYTPEQVLSLIAEVDKAAQHAAAPWPDLTIGERLDLFNNVDKVKANRYDVLAQAYIELLAQTKQP